MKVYTVIAKYGGYDTYSDIYLGTFDSLETVIEQKGIDSEYITKSWGGVPKYIEWLKTKEDMYFNTDNGDCYRIGMDTKKSTEDMWGYSLYVYETELIGKLEHKFVY